MPCGIHSTEIIVAVGGGDQGADFRVVAVECRQTLEPAEDGRNGLVDQRDEDLALHLAAAGGTIFVTFIRSLLLVPSNHLVAQYSFQDGRHFGARLNQATGRCNHAGRQGPGHANHSQKFGHVWSQSERHWSVGIQFSFGLKIECEKQR